jgi:hypothetical protein
MVRRPRGRGSIGSLRRMGELATIRLAIVGMLMEHTSMDSCRFRSIWPALFVLILTVAIGAPRAVARDEFVNRVNAAFSGIPKEKRSDLILLPVLAKMEAPPAEVDTMDKAVLLLPTSPGWDTVMTWVNGQPQRDVLKALREVTKEEDWRISMLFAQGYGVEEVSDFPDLIDAGMYTELGDPPTLATAKFGHMEKILQMWILANLDATRLVKEGNFVEAIDTMYFGMYFARQMAERPMLVEKRAGMRGVRQALERIRDIVYQDMKAEQHKLTYKDLARYVQRLEEGKGYLGIDRILLPTGTIIAAEQILTRVMIEKKGVNEETFAVVMARVAATDRPLRLLSESAYWESIRPQHEGWFASYDMLIGRDRRGGLAADWAKRWSLGPHDPFTKMQSDYRKFVANGPKYAALRAVLSGIEDLMPYKTALSTEVAGTRMSLAIYGYFREHNASFPPSITAIRPKYVPAVDVDPFSSAERPLGYFVPVRDNIPAQDPRKDPVPWTVHCYPPKPFGNFTIPLRADTFVLFSVGPDNDNVNAKDATQEDTTGEGDYILWPPMLSLIRQNLIDTGELK